MVDLTNEEFALKEFEAMDHDELAQRALFYVKKVVALDELMHRKNEQRNEWKAKYRELAQRKGT